MNPGYDSMADEYERAFPEPFRTPLERHAVGAFVDSVKESGVSGQVVDVGCGTGHVTTVLREAGLPVTGVDPSEAMVGIARESHPDVPFEVIGPDAGQWTALAEGHDLAGVLARFSLIHVPPERVPAVLESWAERMPEGGVVMLAFQAMDRGRAVVSFDHAVAPAWRWHPEVMADHLLRAGFREVWHSMSRPDDEHRFPECHLLAVRSLEPVPQDPVSCGCRVE